MLAAKRLEANINNNSLLEGNQERNQGAAKAKAYYQSYNNVMREHNMSSQEVEAAMEEWLDHDLSLIHI